jgi:hypothetical protein
MLRRNRIALFSTAFMAGASLLLAQTPTASSTASSAAPAPRRPSPAGTAATQVGGTWTTEKNGQPRYMDGKWIEITYSRPILRGRTSIFGTGADYGKKVNAGAPVWRAGANQTTKLMTEVPLEIGGKRLAPGAYDLFVDLKEPGWTLIVSTQPTQENFGPAEKGKIWGSDGYDPKYDVVRVPMEMVKLNSSNEQFTIGFVDMTARGGKIAMAWEKTGALVPFKVE